MNQEVQRCNQCRRGCFADNLSCNRGRMYFESLNSKQTNSDVSEDSDKKIPVDIPVDKLVINSEGKEEEDWYISRNENKNNKRRMNNMANNDKQGNELLDLLEKSGRFLHHKYKKGKGQAKILSILAENPNISQKDLQELLEIQSGSISEIAKKLERKGFITRAKDKDDKRMTKLTLTEEGLSRLRLIEERESKTDNNIFQSLNEEEQESLKSLLSKLVQDWNVTDEFSKKDKHHHHGHHKHHHGDHHDHHHGHDHGEHRCECGCYDEEESYGGCGCHEEVESSCVCGCHD